VRLTRRACLAGIGAVAAVPAGGGPLTSTAEALNRAAAAADPPTALRLLDKVAAATPAERLDLEAAREGLEADVLLARSPRSFALALRRRWGTVDPAFARARIDKEHRRLAARATDIFRALGYYGEPLGTLYRRLWPDERFLYPDSDAGRDRAVADMNLVLGLTRTVAPRDFGPLPPDLAAVQVRRMGRTDEAARRAGYRELPAAGRDGGYYIDLADIRRRPRWTLPSVVHHETIPGHLLQSVWEAAAAPHALRLRYTPHFAEGWAIHAEAIAVHADPLATLGQLHWLLFRLCRAQVDLGFALDDWSDERARAWFMQWLGEPAYFISFDEDNRRARAEPAARTAEALAWLSIADAAEGRSRGARLRLHHAILSSGRLRLSSLRRL
jgi:uncharacterized protein (DUF885 family)